MDASSSSSTISTNNNQNDCGRESIVNSDDQTVLQKHAIFFDKNKDGIVYPWETYRGLREVGCGVPLAVGLALFINIGLSGKTRPGKCPSLLFPIEIEHINRAKHGSDTGTYDTEGRFVPEKFEEIFVKYAHTNPNALTSDEVSNLLKGNAVPLDFFGRIGAFAEWRLLYFLGKDKNGLLQKETIRAVYDGSLFEQLKQEHNKSE